MPGIATVPEVALLIGKSRQTVWRMLSKNATLRGCVAYYSGRNAQFSTARLIERGFVLPPTETKERA